MVRDTHMGEGEGHTVGLNRIVVMKSSGWAVSSTQAAIRARISANHPGQRLGGPRKAPEAVASLGYEASGSAAARDRYEGQPRNTERRQDGHEIEGARER